MLWAPLGRTSGTFQFCSQLAWFQPLQETTEPSGSQSSRNPLNNFQIIIQTISFMKFKSNTCTSIETRMLWWKPTGCEQSWKDFDAHHPTGWWKGLNIRHLPYFTRKKAGWEGWVFLPPSRMFIHMPFKKFVHWITEWLCSQWKREENGSIICFMLVIMLSPFCLVHCAGEVFLAIPCPDTEFLPPPLTMPPQEYPRGYSRPWTWVM